MAEPQQYLADGSPLITAAQLGKFRLVRLLVEGGAQVNERNQRGETPLLAACKALRGSQAGSTMLRLLQYLLEHRADPNSQDKAGRTPLIYACMERAGPEVAATLIAAGADPSLEDYAGASALVYGINSHDQATLQVLLDACRERGRDIIIIATDLSTEGDSVTRRYLNVPPSPDSSPVSCMSPSEIELKTSSPSSEADGESIFDFQSADKSEYRSSPKPPHSHRLNSEPWLAIHNLAHLRNSYKEGLRQPAVQDVEAQDQEDDKRFLSSDLIGQTAYRRLSLHGSSDISEVIPNPGRASLTKNPHSRRVPSRARRNTLPVLQDQLLLQLPSLSIQPSSSDSHLQTPLTAACTPAHRSQLFSTDSRSSLSLESSDSLPLGEASTATRQGPFGPRSPARTAFLPPLPVGPTLPAILPACGLSKVCPGPPQASPRPGAQWDRRLRRRHSIQLEQVAPVDSTEKILIL